MRQAFAGMLWSKQYYGYNVARWLDGDPGLPAPPPERLHARNAAWRHFDAADILSMPDPWEYPWFAAWDLAFHAVTFAHIDPAFAKYQLLLLCREWFQHPNGALPAYEWSFDDVNPPVHAASAYMVWIIDGQRDSDFLKRIFNKLLLNFTWWLNREDLEGNDLFAGGFLGLDNIGAFDRSHLPAGTELEQSDATAWMFMYCLNMLRIATALAEEDPAYEDFQTTFIEHAIRIGTAMNRSGLWDDEDGFFYDALKVADGSSVAIKVHSMVGLIPLLPAAVVPPKIVTRGRGLGKRFARMIDALHLSRDTLRQGGFVTGHPGRESLQLSVVPPARLTRMLVGAARREGVPVAPRPAGAVATASRRPVPTGSRWARRAGGLRTRGVDVGPVRRQLELARTRLDAAQLPDDHLAPELGPVDRATNSRSSIRPVRVARSGCVEVGRRHRSPARLDLAPRCRPADVRSTARSRSIRPTRSGTTCSSSTSTSTATRAPASVPRTRPAGPDWSPT